jgi:magnesium-transporting ATPase (P-type)
LRDEAVADGSKGNCDKHHVPSPILMSGSKILNGEGKCVIVAVGDNSIEGKIRKVLESKDPDATPL